MEYLLSDQKEVTEMEVGKILPVEAAAILHASPQFVRIAMQQGKLPIGTAIKMSSIYPRSFLLITVEKI